MKKTYLKLAASTTVWVAVFLPGCHRDTNVHCDESDDCPSGWVCDQDTGRCIPSRDAGGDASGRDATVADDAETPAQDGGERDGGNASLVLDVPPPGQYYHGVYPGGISGWEDDITLDDVSTYEEAAGRQVAWVYFSHNWFHGRQFPLATVTWIRDHGAIPFIRLMLRSDVDEVTGPDPLYSIDAILSGSFDADLRAWGEAAADFGTPLLVEWGTEMNGDWFSWNGRWNGGPDNGPGNFQAAYRHIVETIEEGGAHNLTWVFHVNWDDSPNQDWNRFENYYPGDDVVDWIGLSVYGPQTPLDDYWDDFADGMDAAMPRLVAMAPTKPIFVFEFGVTGANPLGTAASWADAALTGLLSNQWPQVRGFSWWNETWQNDDDPSHDTDMRVQTVPGLSEVFQEHLVGADNLVDRPILSSHD